MAAATTSKLPSWLPVSLRDFRCDALGEFDINGQFECTVLCVFCWTVFVFGMREVVDLG